MATRPVHATATARAAMHFKFKRPCDAFICQIYSESEQLSLSSLLLLVRSLMDLAQEKGSGEHAVQW